MKETGPLVHVRTNRDCSVQNRSLLSSHTCTCTHAIQHTQDTRAHAYAHILGSHAHTCFFPHWLDISETDISRNRQSCLCMASPLQPRPVTSNCPSLHRPRAWAHSLGTTAKAGRYSAVSKGVGSFRMNLLSKSEASL